MPKKRKSRGRAKGSTKGRTRLIQCSKCGQMTPSDKAKKITTRLNLVEHALAKELRSQGAYIATPRTLKYYCVSCAVHYGLVKVRAKVDRQTRR